MNPVFLPIKMLSGNPETNGPKFPRPYTKGTATSLRFSVFLCLTHAPKFSLNCSLNSHIFHVLIILINSDNSFKAEPESFKGLAGMSNKNILKGT